MRTLVLCYHSQNVLGNEYSQNDHVALASDLQAIARRRIPIISMNKLVAYLQGRWGWYPRHAIVLTCDDGTLLDWHAYEHPDFGPQPSFDQILTEFAQGLDYKQSLKHCITSFVIASPQARADIDSGCYGGSPLSCESWWPAAAASERWLFGNHSWDHLHPCLVHAAEGNELGSFYSVDNAEKAAAQVNRATDYMLQRLPANSMARVFAYPYGHCNDYLAEEYFPALRGRYPMWAAVTTEAGFAIKGTHLFRIPRYTCGQHWSQPAEFESILELLLGV